MFLWRTIVLLFSYVLTEKEQNIPNFDRPSSLRLKAQKRVYQGDIVGEITL